MTDRSEGRYIPALGFHWLTPAYDAVVAATTRERRFKQALIAQARLEPDQQVLDLACGTGTLAVWIKQRHPGADVSAIDGDPDILSIARRKAQRAGVAIRFDRGLSFQLPYADARFDRVFSSLFFHHLSWRDKQRTAREIRRVLRPGGELHVADWGRATGPVMRGAFVAIQLLDGFANTRDNVQGRLIDLFEGAGLAEVSQQQTFSTVFGTMALYRAVRPPRFRDGPGLTACNSDRTQENSMEWLTQNWTYLLLLGVILFMRFGGMGCGFGGRHAHPAQGPKRHGTEDTPIESSPPIDPVSRRKVDPKTAVASMYDGRAYYFESRENRDRFEAAPQTYVGPASSEPGDPGHRRHRGGCC